MRAIQISAFGNPVDVLEDICTDTFSALRNAPAKAGDLVAVTSESAGWDISACSTPGTWASKWPRLPVGPTKSRSRRNSEHTTSSTAPRQTLPALGGAKVILITAAGGKTVAATFKGLRPGGVSIVLGVGPEPIEVSSMNLIFGTRRLDGALTGAPAVGDATLRFSALTGVTAMIETVPLEEAPAAYAKMMSGKARFRIVLTMDHVNGHYAVGS